MSYDDRLALYRDIENMRERPLICYVTNTRMQHGAGGQIAPDVISEFTKQINAIPEEYEEVDLLVVSNGGDAITAARIISLLRERFKKVAVLTPYVAYSAATLLALGADEIVMHPFSNLGPVDPQLTVQRPGKDLITCGTEDLRNYFAFVSEIGIADQEEVAKAFELLCQEVGPVAIGIAKRAAHLSLALGEKLLTLHMKDSSKIKTITETLSRSYHHHGYPLSRSEAENIGLPVKRPEKPLERNLWQIWVDLESEMQCNKVFEPLEIILGDPQIVLMPDQVVQKNYELFLGTLESVRAKSECKTKGKITAVQQSDLNIRAGVVQISQGWSYSKTELTELSKEKKPCGVLATQTTGVDS